MLDSFDVMLFAIVLKELIPALGLAKSTAGLLGSLTLFASAFGGLIFGVAADRFGRRKALMASILIYSVFTAACGFAYGVLMLVWVKGGRNTRIPFGPALAAAGLVFLFQPNFLDHFLARP